MVKVVYDGHMRNCRVKIGSTIINTWKRGEVKEISDNIVDRLLSNDDFNLVGKSPIKNKKSAVVEKSKVIDSVKSFDLNNDGVVDEKDVSIAGKVLANAKKINKKNKEEDD